MTLDIFIEVSPGEIRAALLEKSGRLASLRVDRPSFPSLVGGIYLSRVVKVELGMGAAFVDIGANKPAFLGSIGSLHEGEALVVQVNRDAWDRKAANVVIKPRVEGRYLAISQGGKSEPTIEWERNAKSGSLSTELLEVVKKLGNNGEVIRIKPAAVNLNVTQLKEEVGRLRFRIQNIQKSTGTAKPPKLLEPAGTIVSRLLRETPEIGKVLIDDSTIYDEAVCLVSQEMPDLEGKISYYRGDNELFREHDVEEQIDQALERLVMLPNGLVLTIDRTEALSVIDVDLGAAGGRGQKETECTRANLEAIPIIARQISLRNLAGLIVVDFISMSKKSNRLKIVEELRQALRSETNGVVDVLGITAAGLVEITRQRREPTLAEFFTRYEHATLNPVAQACAALREVLRLRGPGQPVLSTNEEVIAVLKGPLHSALVESRRKLGGALQLRKINTMIGFEVGLENNRREN